MSEQAQDKKKSRKGRQLDPDRIMRGVVVVLDPTPRQLGLLASHAGAARFAFNAALNHVKSQLAGCTSSPDEALADWSMYAMRDWWNEWKREIAPWWTKNSKEAYNSGFQSLADAFSNYFDSRDGTRKGPRMGWPKPRRKSKTTPKFTYTTGSFGVADDHGVRLPRIGRVHCLENVRKRVGDGIVKSVTVSKRGGRWQASLQVEYAKPLPVRKLHGSIGCDLGINKFAVLSDGEVVENPHRMKTMAAKRRRASRKASRRQQGSSRWRQAQRESARIDTKLAHQRRNLLDQFTTMLATTYADISIEDLNVKGMSSRNKPKPDPENPGRFLPNGQSRKRGLNREILDQGFGMFRQMLEYKCAQTGARLHIINRWYPSSKRCSRCGTVKTKLSLSTRIYRCKHCGLVIDRDLNAAINLQVAGSAPETLNARGGNARRTPGAHSPDETRTEPLPESAQLGAVPEPTDGNMQTRTN